MSSQTDIYPKRVRDFMAKPPATASGRTTCAELVAKLSAGARSSVVIVDSVGRVEGIVTEYDVARRIAFGVAPESPVSAVMSAPVSSIREDDYVYRAIGLMRRLGLRHLPAVDADGRLVGMMNLDSALAVASRHMLTQIDRLTQGDDVAGMKAINSAQVEVAEQLLQDGLPAAEILELLSHINNDIHRRLTEAAIADMRAGGYGDPPVPISVIVMGSAGRGESLLSPDQDNGFILGDYPDADHLEIDTYFIRLAERLTGALAEVGFERCRGGVMATNPVWRKTSRQWRAQVGLWSRSQKPATILLADIFFDFVPVFGDDRLATDLRGDVTIAMRRNHGFLQAIAEAVDRQGTSLGLLGRIRLEKRGRYRGRVDLKLAGALPLVNSLRLLALREGIAAVSSVERCTRLREAGVLDADSADEVIAAFEHLAGLRLRQQIADYRATGAVSNHVAPSAFNRRERRRLVDALKAIEALRDQVHGEFTGQVF